MVFDSDIIILHFKFLLQEFAEKGKRFCLLLHYY